MPSRKAVQEVHDGIIHPVVALRLCPHRLNRDLAQGGGEFFPDNTAELVFQQADTFRLIDDGYHSPVQGHRIKPLQVFPCLPVLRVVKVIWFFSELLSEY